MAVSAESLQRYREELATRLQQEPRTDSTDSVNLRALAADLDRVKFEAEILPLLEEFVEDALQDTAATYTGEVRMDTGQIVDLAIRDKNGILTTIFEFKRPEKELSDARHTATELLNATPAKNIVFTNGEEFQVFSERNGHVEQILQFSISNTSQDIVQYLESLLDPGSSINKTGVRKLRSRYADVITGQLKYLVRVLNFTTTLKEPPAATLDPTHAFLIDEAGFDGATFRQSTQTLAGILKDNSNELAMAGEQRLNHSQIEAKLGRADGVAEFPPDTELLSEDDANFVEGVFEQLKPSSDEEPSLEVLTESKFYADLARLLDRLAAEYETLLGQRLPATDGGLNDLTYTVGYVISLSFLVLYVLGFSVPIGPGALLVALLFAFDEERIINSRDYLRDL